MKLNRRIATLTLMLLAISLTMAAAWPKEALEAQTPSDEEEGSWQALGPNTTEVVALEASPAFANDDTLFAGTPVGVFRSTDGGDSWQQVNQGLKNTLISALGVCASSASFVPAT